jgi:hypothetical protein
MSRSYLHLTNFLTNLPLQLPIWFVLIGGIIFIGLRWRRHPVPSKFTLFGLLVLIFNLTIWPIVGHWIWDQQYERGGSGSDAALVHGAVTFVSYGFWATGIALLLFAVYSSRLPHAARRAERVRHLDFPFDQPKRPQPAAIPVEERESAIRERKD